MDDPSAAVEAWFTIMVAICVQAAPFLVLGVLISGLIAMGSPARVLDQILPRQPAAAVGAAGMSGFILPGCECASVPIGRSLIRQGVPNAAALTFMLSAPAVNPVVLVATAVAFPGNPAMVVARFAAGMVTAIAVGWFWLRVERRHASLRVLVEEHVESRAGTRWDRFRENAVHDFLHAGGFLVVGAAVAASLHVLVPSAVLQSVADRPVLAVLGLAVLAVVAAVCSEADAFVAAPLTAFSPTALLVFLTVSPMVDVKLISMQAGTFGLRFVVWFAPLTFAVAVAVGSMIGWVAW